MSKLSVTLDEKEIYEAIKAYVKSKIGIEVKNVSLMRSEHDRYPGTFGYYAEASQ